MVSLFRGLSRASLAWLILLFLFVSNPINSQLAPGGVNGSSIWYSETDIPNTVGNYYSFDLLSFENQVDAVDLQLEGSATYFFVLNPKFNSISGVEFLRFGDVVILDNGIEYGQESVDLDFSKGEPLIVSIEMERRRGFANRAFSDVIIGDTSLFSIAELVVFPRRLNRSEMRQVDTYLALKYSVTITENSKEEYQDYFRPNEYTYWNTRVDRLYRNRVIGLGRADNQSFYQSQTVTTKGAPVLVALNYFDSIGQMPTVAIEDESFIIFSEKQSKLTSSTLCASPSKKSHILHNWKFQLQNWRSQAEYLLLKVPTSEVDKRDSLFLSDGYWDIYLPIDRYDGSDFVYKIPLTELIDYRHYFFTNSRGSDCIEVITFQESGELNVEAMLASDKEWILETQSLDNGTLISERISGTHGRRFLQDGQYVVSVLDENGQVMGSQIVRIQSSSNSPSIGIDELDIRVYPDPVEAGHPSTLAVRNLPSTEPLQMIVSDMNGKIHQSVSLDGSDEIIQSIAPLSIPGTYTVTLYQGSSLYSVKLVVRSN